MRPRAVYRQLHVLAPAAVAVDVGCVDRPRVASPVAHRGNVDFPGAGTRSVRIVGDQRRSGLRMRNGRNHGQQQRGHGCTHRGTRVLGFTGNAAYRLAEAPPPVTLESITTSARTTGPPIRPSGPKRLVHVL